MEFAPGDIIANKYRVLARISGGGFADVYKMELMATGALRALKTMKLVPGTDLSDLKRSLVAEADILHNCRHPNIVEIFEIRTAPDQTPMLIMEFLSGMSLSGAIRESTQPFPVDRAVGLIISLCDAFTVVHRRQVTHRDVKPGNIILDGDTAKLIDFGIAKVHRTAQFKAPTGLVIAQGQIIGSPAYLSPEQARGFPDDELDGRCDMYSLALVLYEMLTLRLPFDDTSIDGLALRIHFDAVSPAKFNPSLPPALCNVILKALARERDDRYPSMVEFKQALQASLGHSYENADSFEFRVDEPFAVAAAGRSPRGEVTSSTPHLSWSVSSAVSGRHPRLLVFDFHGVRAFKWEPKPVPQARNTVVVRHAVSDGAPRVTSNRIVITGPAAWLVFEPKKEGDDKRFIVLRDASESDSRLDLNERHRENKFGPVEASLARCLQHWKIRELHIFATPECPILFDDIQLENILESTGDLKEIARRIAAFCPIGKSASVVVARIPG